MRKCAFGLMVPLWWFFIATLASAVLSMPYSSKYRLAAMANSDGAVVP